MKRWLVWFGVGATLWLMLWVQFARGALERGNTLSTLLVFAGVGWFGITGIAVPIRIIMWLVRPRRVTSNASD